MPTDLPENEVILSLISQIRDITNLKMHRNKGLVYLVSKEMTMTRPYSTEDKVSMEMLELEEVKAEIITKKCRIQ